MISVPAVRCDGCGGTVVVEPGQAMPRCLFCGSDAASLVPFTAEDVEEPEGFLPFAVDEASADQAFRTFCGGSFWYPGDLKSASLSLRPLLLPAWAWSGRLETHWAGLVSARSPSGKRPISGMDVCAFEQVLVPASTSLRLAELTALGPYDDAPMQAVAADSLPAPHELSEMTRSAAQGRAEAEMERRHRAQIAVDSGTTGLNVASVSDALEGRPVLLPVWIGAFQYGDRTYRILVNGQTAVLHGEAPISMWRVLGVVLAVLAGLGAVVLAMGLCAGGAAVAG